VKWTKSTGMSIQISSEVCFHYSKQQTFRSVMANAILTSVIKFLLPTGFMTKTHSFLEGRGISEQEALVDSAFTLP